MKILPFKPKAQPQEEMGLPQDHAKPEHPCAMCGRVAWIERAIQLGGGWYCGRCH